MALTGLTNLQPLHVHSIGISTFDGSVSVGGTLTYEDVTNVDSIGIVTARDDINIITDGKKLNIGASADLQLHHTANHSYIDDAGAGNLRLRSGTLEIQNLASSKTSAIFSSGGGQTLNFNNSTKFVTTNTGVVITGICTATSFKGDGSNLTGITGTTINNNADNRIITGSGTANTLNGESTLTYDGTNLDLGDNKRIRFGASSDLQIYHDGFDTRLHNLTGNFLIRNEASSGNIFIRTKTTESAIDCVPDGAVNLYFNGNKKFETSNTGVNIAGICTATSFSGSGEGLTRTTQLSHRNIIINGDFKIAQRATSHNSSGYRTVDRFKMNAGGASHTLTQAQVDVASGTTPYTEGFRKAYSITNAGQNANNQAYAYMQYSVEAQDLATSGWNYTSSSSFITISFWIKASVTQTYLFFLHTNDGGTKEYNHLMSLSANAWTKITLNVPGNSGLQFDNDNGLGLNIYWTAYLGDHYTSTGSVNQWVTHAGYTSRPDMGSTWWTTSNATFQLTGVQLEVGSVATPFEHRIRQEELERCKRYCHVLSHTGYSLLGIGMQYYSGYIFIDAGQIDMRVTPTMTAKTSSVGAYTYEKLFGNSPEYIHTISLDGKTTREHAVLNMSGNNTRHGQAVRCSAHYHNLVNNESFMYLDAEL